MEDTDHLVRCECLDLIGSLATSDMNINEEGREASTSQSIGIQDLLGMYTRDQDPRVRTAAFQSMVSWIVCDRDSAKKEGGV